MPTPSLARTLKSIQNLVDEQEWYAAHQKYRTSAVRLIKVGTPSSMQDAASLLYEGARLLMERNQPGSGTDLALMLIKDVYNSPNSPSTYSPERRAQLMHLIVLTSGHWRKSIIDASVAYTGDVGPCAYGDPELHTAVGELLAKEGDLQQASYHLLAGCSRDAARTLADVMLVWSKEESAGPHDGLGSLGKYAARGVLGYLELGSILPARTFLDVFLTKCATTYPQVVHSTVSATIDRSEVSVRVCTVPSLNFLQLLVLTCQVGPGVPSARPRASNSPQLNQGAPVGRAAYQAMVGRYPRIVGWLDGPGVKDCLSVIGEDFMGIKAPRAGNNLLGDLMSSLFGGAPGAGPPAGRGRGRASPAAASPGLD